MLNNKILKPKDLLKKVSKEKLKSKNTIVIFYLDINKNIISSHKKKYLEKFNLNVSEVFIPAFYLGAKFIVIANVMPKNYKSKVSKYEKRIVSKIFKASCFLNVFLLDYLVVSKNKYYSFHESDII